MTTNMTFHSTRDLTGLDTQTAPPEEPYTPVTPHYFGNTQQRSFNAAIKAFDTRPPERHRHDHHMAPPPSRHRPPPRRRQLLARETALIPHKIRKQRNFKVPEAPWREASESLLREAQERIDGLMNQLSSGISADDAQMKARGVRHAATVAADLRHDWRGLCESRNRWYEATDCISEEWRAWKPSPHQLSLATLDRCKGDASHFPRNQPGVMKRTAPERLTSDGTKMMGVTFPPIQSNQAQAKRLYSSADDYVGYEAAYGRKDTKLKNPCWWISKVPQKGQLFRGFRWRPEMQHFKKEYHDTRNKLQFGPADLNKDISALTRKRSNANPEQLLIH